MEKAKYVLNLSHRVLERSSKEKVAAVARKVLLGSLVLLIILSFVMGENLFSEFSFGTKAIWFCALIGSIFYGDSNKVAIPMNIAFYDNYLIMTIPEKKRGKDIVKMQNKMYYSDITGCKYKKKIGNVYFYGRTEYKRWNYKKDGSLSEKPARYNDNDEGFSFNVSLEKDDSWIATVEKYLPVHIEVV